MLSMHYKRVTLCDSCMLIFSIMIWFAFSRHFLRINFGKKYFNGRFSFLVKSQTLHLVWFDSYFRHSLGKHLYSNPGPSCLKSAFEQLGPGQKTLGHLSNLVVKSRGFAAHASIVIWATHVFLLLSFRPLLSSPHGMLKHSKTNLDFGVHDKLTWNGGGGKNSFDQDCATDTWSIKRRKEESLEVNHLHGKSGWNGTLVV